MPIQEDYYSGMLLPHLSDTISLPVQGYAFWIGDEQHYFTATASKPNRQAGQYPDNDSYSARFNMPDLVNIPIVTMLRTNKQAYRYSMELRDI